VKDSFKIFWLTRHLSLIFTAIIAFLTFGLLWIDLLIFPLFNIKLVNEGLVGLSSAVIIVAGFSALSFSASASADGEVKKVFVKSGERLFYATILLAILLILAFFFSNLFNHGCKNLVLRDALLFGISAQTLILGSNVLWNIGKATYFLLEVFQKYDPITSPTEFKHPQHLG